MDVSVVGGGGGREWKDSLGPNRVNYSMPSFPFSDLNPILVIFTKSPPTT